MSVPKDGGYIGEPGYPAPWTTSTPREGLRDTDAARIISLAPDVCRSPTVPVPYPVVDFCGHDQNYTGSVRFTGQKAMVMRSSTSHVHGDEPGTGLGIKSGTVGGISEPITHAAQVRAEGSPVIRHLDRFKMNNGNTLGEAVFIRETSAYATPKDDDPLPGSMVMTEASPDPWIAGERYAQALPNTSDPVVGSPIINDSTPNTKPLNPNFPAANDNRPLDRRGAFGRPLSPGKVVPGIAGAFLALDEVGERARNDYYPGGRLHRLHEDLISRGIQLDQEDPAQYEALYKYSENLGGTSFVRRNFYPPMTEEEALAQLELDLAAARLSRRAVDELQAPAEVLESSSVRVTEDEPQGRPCLVGPYSEISKICVGEAHHIVPDMVYRLGARPTTAAAMASPASRIPNAPTLNQGMSICLTEAQHGRGATGLHGYIRAAFAAMTSQVAGTAPMGDILEVSNASIDSIIDLPVECRERAKAAATGQVMATTGLAAPGRVRESPLPSGQAEIVLKRGYY